ncbi:hypothetical protein P43SY_005958 [Pythium insidiosum]|uniref:Receptor expression-enhancing protein n=1 Tax=Pythium insidiosum TaxID=114742 RepID=A0AAD5LZP0_PYTIN|nr:hypothetical protein P43SY_005958 [Pythium insidiosum]
MVLVGQWTARQCCVLIGYVFPIYKSSRALRRQDTKELLQWVTFWTVNALFWAVELVGDTVVGWLPFYFEAKIAFLLWLVLPSSAGARVLHDLWLAPTFEKHEEVIDLTLTDMKRRASEKVKEVCKETAVLALRRGSGVVAQGQQYVAAQLVQQALGKLQTPSTSSGAGSAPTPVSSVLSLLAAAATPMAPLASSVSTAPTTLAAEAKSSSKVDEAFKPNVCDSKADCNDCEDDDDCKSQRKATNNETEHKALDKDVTTAQQGHRDTKELKPLPATPITSPKAPSTREEKSKELVAHFKKLLARGFAVTYYASEGSRKQRCIRLETPQSRHVVFENAKKPGASPSKKAKAIRLCIHNIRRIASGRGDATEDASGVDSDRAFVLDNGKSVLLFEADSAKTRDLLVAGMRLLIAERKRLDSAAIATLVGVHEKQLKQHAFDRWLFEIQRHSH